MLYFVVFELSAFVFTGLCLLTGVVTLFTVSVIITLILSFVSLYITVCLRESRKLSAGLVSGLFSLLPASQFVAYFCYGLTAVQSTHLRIVFLFLFAVYGIVSLCACFVADYLMTIRIVCEERNFFLPPVLVFAVGWIINFFLFL